jgi:hypothetical protein
MLVQLATLAYLKGSSEELEFQVKSMFRAIVLNLEEYNAVLLHRALYTQYQWFFLLLVYRICLSKLSSRRIALKWIPCCVNAAACTNPAMSRSICDHFGAKVRTAIYIIDPTCRSDAECKNGKGSFSQITHVYWPNREFGWSHTSSFNEK